MLSDLLADYEDRWILDTLRYGWLIDRDPEKPLEMGGINHKGATEHEKHIDDYIEREIAPGAMIGPFECIPFKSQVAISPLSTRAKKDSEQRRIVMDCSWPIGFSLNDGLDKDMYLNQSITLKYPTIDMLARRVYELNKTTSDVWLFREDLDRAFRQFYACPSLVPLLGFKWRGQYYFDLVLMMGCKIAPYICQKSTSMITYIHNNMGFYLLNYVDDFVGAELGHRIQKSHTALIRLLHNIGMQRSEKKSIPLTQIIEFVGNLINTVDMMLGVTPQRKIDVLRELETWRYRKFCTRRQLESLIGKLQFMSNVVRPGRLFVSRLLTEMKKMQRGKQYYINQGTEERYQVVVCFSS